MIQGAEETLRGVGPILGVRPGPVQASAEVAGREPVAGRADASEATLATCGTRSCPRGVLAGPKRAAVPAPPQMQGRAATRRATCCSQIGGRKRGSLPTTCMYLEPVLRALLSASRVPTMIATTPELDRRLARLRAIRRWSSMQRSRGFEVR